MRELNRPIVESYWVEPGSFLAGEFPAHAFGEQLIQRLDKFLDFGINTYIDLTDPDELPSYSHMLSKRAEYYDLDIHYKRFTIKDHDIPPSETMKAILDEIDSALASGRKIYVHCWGGIGRTGTVVGCYLVRHGYTGQQALKQMSEWWREVPKSRIWLHTPETKEQMDFILNWQE